MNFRLDRVGLDVADPAERPGDGIPDLDVLVGHHVNEDGQRLVDQRLENGGIGAVKDRAECHYGSFALMPILRTDIRLDEGDYCGHDVICDGLGQKTQTCASGHGDIPLVLVCILLLASQQLEKDWQDFRKRDLGKEFTLGLGDFSILSGLLKNQDRCLRLSTTNIPLLPPKKARSLFRTR